MFKRFITRRFLSHIHNSTNLNNAAKQDNKYDMIRADLDELSSDINFLIGLVSLNMLFTGISLSNRSK